MFLWSCTLLIMKCIISWAALHWQWFELPFGQEGTGQALQEVSLTARGVCRSVVLLSAGGGQVTEQSCYLTGICDWKIMICIQIPSASRALWSVEGVKEILACYSRRMWSPSVSAFVWPSESSAESLLCMFTVQILKIFRTDFFEFLWSHWIKMFSLKKFSKEFCKGCWNCMTCSYIFWSRHLSWYIDILSI